MILERLEKILKRMMKAMIEINPKRAKKIVPRFSTMLVDSIPRS